MQVFEGENQVIDSGLRITQTTIGHIFSASIRLYPSRGSDSLSIANIGSKNFTVMKTMECKNTTMAVCGEPDEILATGECRTCAIVMVIQGSASISAYEVCRENP